MAVEFLRTILGRRYKVVPREPECTATVGTQGDLAAQRAREILDEREKQAAYFEVYLPSAVKRYLSRFVRDGTLISPGRIQAFAQRRPALGILRLKEKLPDPILAARLNEFDPTGWSLTAMGEMREAGILTDELKKVRKKPEYDDGTLRQRNTVGFPIVLSQEVTEQLGYFATEGTEAWESLDGETLIIQGARGEDIYPILGRLDLTGRCRLTAGASGSAVTPLARYLWELSIGGVERAVAWADSDEFARWRDLVGDKVVENLNAASREVLGEACSADELREFLETVMLDPFLLDGQSRSGLRRNHQLARDRSLYHLILTSATARPTDEAVQGLLRFAGEVYADAGREDIAEQLARKAESLSGLYYPLLLKSSEFMTYDRYPEDFGQRQILDEGLREHRLNIGNISANWTSAAANLSEAVHSREKLVGVQRPLLNIDFTQVEVNNGWLEEVDGEHPLQEASWIKEVPRLVESFVEPPYLEMLRERDAERYLYAGGIPQDVLENRWGSYFLHPAFGTCFVP